MANAIPLYTPDNRAFGGLIAYFMDHETQTAKNWNLNVPLRRDNDESGFTSGRLGTFANQSLNMSICGLEGCAVMGVISDRGAWLVHIWEVPSLTTGGYFERDVLNVIWYGDQTIDPSNGLPWVANLNHLKGPGQIFNAAYNPRIFTLAPGDPNEDQNAQRRYPWQVSRMEHELQQIFPGAQTISVGYALYPLAQAHAITAKGKILLQYTPAQYFSPNGTQIAMIRIYVTDNAEDVCEFTWAAHPDQMI